jgi:transcriptional regulator with XRE-family HTH domain
LTGWKLPVIIANMASDPPTLGTRIRRARERKRLSQEELAAKVGASERAVNDWENDRRRPRNRLGALEEVLGVSLTGNPAGRPVISEDLMAAIMDDPELTGDERHAVIAAVEAQLARERAQRGQSAPAPAAGAGRRRPAS